MPSAIRIPQLELIGIEEQLDVNPSEVEVINTAALTTVYNFVVPAGSLGTNRLLRVGMIADYLNNDLFSARGIRMRIRFGGAILYDSASAATAIGNSPRRRAVLMEVDISNRDDVDRQIGGGFFVVGLDAIPTAGVGAIADLATADRTGGEFATEATGLDTSVAQTMEISIAHSGASNLISFRKQLGYATIVRVE